ncbi:MAG: helix-turn-helix transcriptional regulator [Thermodesulfobacteriota bacterium]|nr:helix-turn-helix transcriptional regulator [Thermodesulfobacteriota bacterium]
MSIDKQLEDIRRQFHTINAKLNQVEKLKDAVEVNLMGEMIRSTRKKQKLTRQALCELSGVSYTTLNKIETGSLSLRMDIVLNVAKALGLGLWIG